MSDLYTVTLRKKQVISRFDTKGKLLEPRTEFVTSTISDLPHRTALTYQRMFPDAFVGMELQPKSGPAKNAGYKTKGQGRPTSVKTEARSEKQPGLKKGEVTSTSSGKQTGYSDVINKMLEDA